MKKDDTKLDHLFPTFKDARKRTKSEVENIEF